MGTHVIEGPRATEEVCDPYPQVAQINGGRMGGASLWLIMCCRTEGCLGAADGNDLSRKRRLLTILIKARVALHTNSLNHR